MVCKKCDETWWCSEAGHRGGVLVWNVGRCAGGTLPFAEKATTISFFCHVLSLNKCCVGFKPSFYMGKINEATGEPERLTGTWGKVVRIP